MLIRLLLSLLLLTFAASCSSNKAAKEKQAEEEAAKQAAAAPEKAASDLYEKGLGFLDEGRYSKAVEMFEQIEREYPYSRLANRALLMDAVAYYKDEEYDMALVTLERFIALYPGNEQIAYAYHLRALCYYEQIVDVRRDQSITERAQAALQEVVARFPGTSYARDSKLKLDLVRDHLAGKEMEIGRFYQKKGNLIGAINRFKVVVNDYDTTSHVPEALHRLVESYMALGIVPEAQKYAAVLGHNYPDSKWYNYSYELFGEKK